MIKRALFFGYGVAAYATFLGTFLYAIGFVSGFAAPKVLDAPADGPLARALLTDAALLALFAVQHSVMARRWFKERWTRLVPGALERSTYVLFASLALILLFWKWKPLGIAIWTVSDPVARLVLWMVAAFGWMQVLVTTFLINHFDLFGLRQVWLQLVGRPYTKVSLATPMPYRVVRHPLYLGFLLAFWSTPTMTAGHLFFAVMTTAYILVAIQFEEQDLVREHGTAYEHYRRMVPMILPGVRRARPVAVSANERDSGTVKQIMHTRTLPLLGLAVALAIGGVAAGHEPRGEQERFLYVATIAQSASDPDFIAVVGADPRRGDFGRIVNRIDMPNIGDELHHFGYSADQERLMVPGLFSGRIHIFDVERDSRKLTLRAVNDRLVNDSGYIVPHSVIGASAGRAIVTMIGAATGTTEPGGIVQINDSTGAFESYFGPGPLRDPGDLGPKYMYDFDSLVEANRGISTTFGPPALCGGGINPSCLGGEVSVWNLAHQKVIQVADLGANSGALEVRFIEQHGVRRAFINTPGTSAVWLAHDEDGDGVFTFQQVLGPEDGLVLPVDMLLSSDNKYMYLTNWFGNTVQQFDIADPFNPVLTATVAVPHPNMLRLSRDNRRLYVSNSLLTPWDNDPGFGPSRNNDYGIWLFDVDRHTGGLSSVNPDGRAWVRFAAVRKKTSVGPAGPHMMLFDPSIRLAPGEH